MSAGRWILPIVLAAAVGGSVLWGAPVRSSISIANHAAGAEELRKAKGLYAQQKFSESLEEAEKALALDPTLTEAQSLRRALQARIEADAAAPGTATAVGSSKARLLNAKQISTIRLLESGRNDTLIRGSVPRKTLEDFWDNEIKKQSNTSAFDLSKTAHDHFMSPNNFGDQARRIRDSGNLKFIEQVTVTSDPANLLLFRTTINPYVLQSCATSECHGGEKAGSFRLIASGNNDQTIYTNFYIMSMYTSKVGEGRMIDREHPDKSLFLQYSLPKTVAVFPHPGKADTRRLASVTDPRLRMMSDWVQSLGILRPTYGITFEVPKGVARATTEPAPTAPTPPGRGR